MPLNLTTPKSAGDLDPNAESYAQVKVSSFKFNTRDGLLRFKTELGNTVDSVWVRGIAGAQSFEIEGEDFQTIATTHTTLDAELTYDAVARAMYEWLISEGHYAGTVS